MSDAPEEIREEDTEEWKAIHEPPLGEGTSEYADDFAAQRGETEIEAEDE